MSKKKNLNKLKIKLKRHEKHKQKIEEVKEEKVEEVEEEEVEKKVETVKPKLKLKLKPKPNVLVNDKPVIMFKKKILRHTSKGKKNKHKGTKEKNKPPVSEPPVPDPPVSEPPVPDPPVSDHPNSEKIYDILETKRNIPFDKLIIPPGQYTDRTISIYKNRINFIYNSLSDRYPFLKNTDIFFWEFLSQPEIITEAVKKIMEKYTIRSSGNLTSFLNPIKTYINFVPDQDVNIAQITWAKKFQEITVKFDTILKETVVNEDKIKSLNTKKTALDWEVISKKLLEVSNNITIDPRIRMLATIYGYGYVYRIQQIFSTRIVDHPLSEEELTTGNINKIYLSGCLWYMNKSKTGRKQTIHIVPDMCAKIQKLAAENLVFSRGYIMPQKSGIPYSDKASMSSLSRWKTEHKLPNNHQMRTAFETWLRTKSGYPVDKVNYWSEVLDHTVKTAILHYVRPLE